MHSPSLFLITIWCYHRLSSPPCRALICKVSTFLCVCVVWFVVVVSLFLIRPALTKPSLYCHIWALLGSGTFSESHPDLNCFKKAGRPAFLFGSPFSLASLLPFHHRFLCSSVLSLGLTQMEGYRDERGSHIAYNAHLHWGLYGSLTYVSLHMAPLKRDTWLPRAEQGKDKSSVLYLHWHPKHT